MMRNYTMMKKNKEEIKNRLDFLSKQIPEKKLLVERSIRELQAICDEILVLNKQLNSDNEDEDR